MFPLPDRSGIRRATQTVFTDNDWDQIKPINQGDYDTVPKVIPAHLGGHSPIKHVVVIIRENRTYDQVLGDLGEGNGDPADAQFGAQITPNAHALATGSVTSTTSTTRARSRPTATTGSSRPRPTTTSRRSSGRSTARIRRRAATRSPTSATASSGTPPRRPA